jgi:hypothetical protein
MGEVTARSATAAVTTAPFAKTRGIKRTLERSFVRGRIRNRKGNQTAQQGAVLNQDLNPTIFYYYNQTTR